MKIFTIENETNNIIVHASVEEAKSVVDAECFRHEAGLAKLAANWPAARLIDIWNSLPGATPVKKFTDRGTAVSRIWKAIQTLGEQTSAEGIHKPEPVPEPAAAATDAAPQTPHVAPVEAAASKRAARAKEPRKAAGKAAETREGSKTASVVELLKRPGGVTLAELMSATGWQAHSVRGFLSGTVGKKMGLTVTSAQSENGERVYSVAA